MARKDREMPIQRKVVQIPKKRNTADIAKTAERIGELLGIEKTPSHVMAWKEPRLLTTTNDCYPLVSVLEKLAEEIAELKVAKPKKAGRPPKND